MLRRTKICKVICLSRHGVTSHETDIYGLWDLFPSFELSPQEHTSSNSDWDDNVSCNMYWYSLCHVRLMSCPLPLPDANASMTISTLC